MDLSSTLTCSGKIGGMTSPPNLDQLNSEQLRALAAQLLSQVDIMGRKIHRDQAVIEKLTHEIAQLKRFKFAKRSEQLNPQQTSLLDDLIDTDIAAIEAELQTLQTPSVPTETKQKPKRTALPPEFPRTLIHHEPDNTQCSCGCTLKRIGEDVSEKLDYTPGVFTVERHIRGKWVCDDCETLIQAPVPAQVIDKGIPTAGLLAHVMIAKFADHLPLYRQESIFGRAGLAIARSTLAQWVGNCGVQLQPLVDALRDAVLEHGVIHADETPVQMLTPGAKKTHRAYVWAYATSQFSDLAAVVYDFSPSRAGEHARNFLQDWKGKLVCDDFGGYKASFELGVTEIGCMAHARRKFFRTARHAQKPTCRTGLAIHPVAVRNRACSPRPGTGFTPPDTARKSRAGDGRTAYLDDRPASACARWLGYQQSSGLQPETLDGVVALPR